jgi:hypothetical protein
MAESAITEIGARDRLVMTGLVLLGLLTVIAGVLSGRSTIDYVLGRDAREAALSWAGQIDKSLAEQGPHAPQLLDQSVEVLDAQAFAGQAAPATLPSSPTVKDDFPLVEQIDRLTTGWALSHMYQSQSDFVSQLKGFAVLAPDQTPLARRRQAHARRPCRAARPSRQQGRAGAVRGRRRRGGGSPARRQPSAPRLRPGDG